MRPWKISCFAIRVLLYLARPSSGCETDGDCAEGLCLGGACDCPEKRYGDTCIMDCTVDQHCNGGTCLENGTCRCPGGQYGIQCEDFCTSHSDCSNGGTCVVRHAVKICDCSGLYYGEHCENAHECNLDTACRAGWECSMDQEPYLCLEGTSTESNLPLVLKSDDIPLSSGAGLNSLGTVPFYYLGLLAVGLAVCVDSLLSLLLVSSSSSLF